jgi:nucleotide-binding universal stress UspA family protein
MKSILIAYDGSAVAESILGELPRAGLPRELDVFVLSAADVFLPTLESAPDESTAVKNVRRKAMAEYEKAQSQAAHAAKVLQGLAPQWNITPVTVAASPALAICHEAAQRNVDLVVVGAHGLGLLHRLFLGSVTTKVATEASCSVRVSRPHREPGFQHLRIMLAVDGSHGSDLALQAARQRPWPQGTSFHIAAVMDERLASTVAVPGSAAASHAQAADTDSGVWLVRMLEAAAAPFREAGYYTETRVLMGDPKKSLPHHADEWGAHCIMMGAQGMSHGHGRRLGSLANALLTRAHCSVEIIRPEQEG